ncbi:sugar phosphate isomerase/epimerase family protein [Negadavirga shengliensis]|uniref:Sugar phosphate isomerase/epimerase family protein n=1 Tax=Negadavirga shengliensis TaxID=1389218 RepID=A0ABV9T0U2_9BACT
MTNKPKYNRRTAVKKGILLTALAGMQPLTGFMAPPRPHAYRIGACDWSIGQASDPEAFRVAKEIGLDGVQVSLGNVSNNMHLRRKEVQQTYLQTSKDTQVRIASLAIGELNNVPYKSDPVTEEWVEDSIDVAKALGCQVILLAFFGKGDLREDEEGKKEVIRRLQKVAPKAEKQDIYLALESWLSAEEHLRIIEAVGSSHVKVYYDVANSTEMGYDIFKEMKLLGTEYICEIHAKENGQLLGKGKVDFGRVKNTLQEIGYKDWVIMEGAIPPGGDMLTAYQANLAYLRRVLNNQ